MLTRESLDLCPRFLEMSSRKRALSSEPLNQDALAGHLEHCLRQTSTSVFRQMWDLQEQPLGTPFRVPGPSGPLPGLPKQSLTSSSERASQAKAAAVSIHVASSIRISQTWRGLKDREMQAAMRKWVAIIRLAPEQFDLGRRSTRLDPLAVDFQRGLQHVFSGKAAGTLNNRANPLLRYVAWCNYEGLQVFPIQESDVYDFLCSVEASCSPSFPRSLVSSLNFGFHILGMTGADDACSPRVIGLARGCFLQKRKKKPKPPLSVDMVKGLERLVCNASAPPGDRIVAGFFLVCVYARARFSDALHMEELKVDRVPGPQLHGYLETAVSRSKTSYTVERKTEHLPMVVPLRGLTGKDWVSAWVALRTEQVMPSGPGVPLLVLGSKRGGWTQVPPTASFAAAWLRGLLANLEFKDDVVTALGTHSCKATCLSWTGKFGISAEHQRVLGYHTAPGDSMRLLYSRDGIAPAVRDLEKVLSMIRSGEFCPDQTRSGYFPGQAVEPIESEAPEDPLLHVPVSESEPSEDEEDNCCDHEAFEMAAEEICDDWQGPAADANAVRAPMVRHNLSRLIHCLLDDSGNTLRCGRKLSKNYTRLAASPRFLHPTCSRCFPDK